SPSSLAQRSEKLPCLVWFHGGGYTIGGVSEKLTDITCREMCRRTNSVVVSVEYRLAPEHPFPAALEDAFAALAYLSELDEGKVDSLPVTFQTIEVSRVDVGGDSAVGNLATLMY